MTVQATFRTDPDIRKEVSCPHCGWILSYGPIDRHVDINADPFDPNPKRYITCAVCNSAISVP